jgi:hypothetical protein
MDYHCWTVKVREERLTREKHASATKVFGRHVHGMVTKYKDLGETPNRSRLLWHPLEMTTPNANVMQGGEAP